MININFSEDFNTIINGLRNLQNHLESELNKVNNYIDYLNTEQMKNDEFFKNLETLIQKRNM